jgi:hypothetical protein
MNEFLYRDMAQAALPGATVLDACPFGHRGMVAAKVASSQFGLLGWFINKRVQKQRAGGLPERFLIAVTDDSVYVLEHKLRGMRDTTGHAGDELAVWSREAVGVSWDTAGIMYTVTLEVPGAERPIKCQVGRAAASERFLRLLAGQEAMAA